MASLLVQYETWCPECGQGRVNSALPPTTCPTCEKQQEGMIVLVADYGITFRFKAERQQARGQA